MTEGVLPDLWDRLALLDQCCDVSTSTVRLRDERGGEQRKWMVVVERRSNPAEFFKVTAESTSVALTMAVLEAERRGWRTQTAS